MATRRNKWLCYARRYALVTALLQTFIAYVCAGPVLQRTLKAAQVDAEAMNAYHVAAGKSLGMIAAPPLTDRPPHSLPPKPARALQLVRRSNYISATNANGNDAPPEGEPPEYQTPPQTPSSKGPLRSRVPQSSSSLSSSSSTTRKAGSNVGGGGGGGGGSTQHPWTGGYVDQHSGLRPFMKPDMARAAYADNPRWLGAFMRVADGARPYNALMDEVRALKTRIKVAAAAAARQERRGGGGSGSGGDNNNNNSAARHVAELRSQLAAAEEALAAARQRTSQLSRFARDIAKRLGALPRRSPDAAVEQRMAASLDGIVAQLGAREELEALGRRVLADAEAGPRVPAGAEALTPEVSWERAADVLARDALELERRTGDTWLVPGGDFGSKEEYLLRFRSLWGALKARQRETGRAPPLTEVMEWRLRQEIDRAYTQCIIDHYPEYATSDCQYRWTYRTKRRQLKPRLLIPKQALTARLEAVRAAYEACLENGGDSDTCMESTTEWTNGVVFRPRLPQTASGHSNSGSSSSSSSSSSSGKVSNNEAATSAAEDKRDETGASAQQRTTQHFNRVSHIPSVGHTSSSPKLPLRLPLLPPSLESTAGHLRASAAAAAAAANHWQKARVALLLRSKGMVNGDTVGRLLRSSALAALKPPLQRPRRSGRRGSPGLAMPAAGRAWSPLPLVLHP